VTQRLEPEAFAKAMVVVNRCLIEHGDSDERWYWETLKEEILRAREAEIAEQTKTNSTANALREVFINLRDTGIRWQGTINRAQHTMIVTALRLTGYLPNAPQKEEDHT
jgi:hypothetical protein